MKMYAKRAKRSSRLGRVGRYSSRLGDFNTGDFLTTLVNDAATVAKVAVQPTTNISSMVSPTGVQNYSYSAPGIGTTTGVASLSGGSSGLLLLGGLAIVAVMLLRR